MWRIHSTRKWHFGWRLTRLSDVVEFGGRTATVMDVDRFITAIAASTICCANVSGGFEVHECSLASLFWQNRCYVGVLAVSDDEPNGKDDNLLDLGPDGQANCCHISLRDKRIRIHLPVDSALDPLEPWTYVSHSLPKSRSTGFAGGAVSRLRSQDSHCSQLD